MDARAILARLRRREVPEEAELRWFAQGLADHGVSDAQAGALPWRSAWAIWARRDAPR